MQDKLKERARKLRKYQSEAEGHMWYLLRNRNFNRYKFKRQYIIAPYIVDFVCLHKKLIIELDGGQHANAIPYDKARTIFLESKGFKVLRFWNRMLFEEQQNVMEMILRELQI